MPGFEYEETGENSCYSKCPSLLVINFALNAFKERQFFYIIAFLVSVFGFFYMCHIIWIYVEKLFCLCASEISGKVSEFLYNRGGEGGGGRRRRRSELGRRGGYDDDDDERYNKRRIEIE